MAFCRYSSEFVSRNNITLDNTFINEFMPNAPDACVKVYLYGLAKCNNSSSIDNTIEDFVKVLDIPAEDIENAFYYWQELGLVQVLNLNPIEVRYLPVSRGSSKLKKYNVDKFKNFNISVQELIEGRMITPREFEEFYYIIENLHMEQDALLMVVNYCVKLKGKGINTTYIATVAKNWAYEGLKTCEDIEERILDQERSTGTIVDILKAMGLKRTASFDEYQMYIEWTRELDIPLDVIMYLAGTLKKTQNAYNKLNTLVNKCYAAKLTSVKEVKDYFDSQDTMYAMAKTICRNLGIRYDNLETVVDNYIANWVALGFDETALSKIANLCFKSNIKTLEGMNSKLMSLFKLGLLTSESVDNYIDSMTKDDEKIVKILNALGIDRNVNPNDRTLYKTWIYDWNITSELLEYALSLSKNMYLPLQFLNKILATYHTNNIKTVSEAEALSKTIEENKKAKTTTTTSNKKPKQREYTAEQLNGLFDNIMEIEI